MPVPVIDGRTFFRCSLLPAATAPAPGTPLSYYQTVMRQRAQAAGVTVAAPSERSETTPILAQVNHNRWIALCPDCSGSEYVWLDEPVFMCETCWNAAIGGQWRPITVPADAEAITRVLMARPQLASRNWLPDETLTTLRGENVAHGLPEEGTDGLDDA